MVREPEFFLTLGITYVAYSDTLAYETSYPTPVALCVLIANRSKQKNCARYVGQQKSYCTKH